MSKSGQRIAWFGNRIREGQYVDAGANLHFVDQHARIGLDGRVTAFRIYAKRAGSLKLVIYRRVGESLSVVGKSQIVTVEAVGPHELTLESPIEVNAGDMVGWHNLELGVIGFSMAGPEPFAHSRERVAWGARPSMLTTSQDRVYAIRVKMEGVKPTSLRPWIADQLAVLDGKIAAQQALIDALAGKVADLTQKLEAASVATRGERRGRASRERTALGCESRLARARRASQGAGRRSGGAPDSARQPRSRD